MNDSSKTWQPVDYWSHWARFDIAATLVIFGSVLAAGLWAASRGSSILVKIGAPIALAVGLAAVWPLTEYYHYVRSPLAVRCDEGHVEIRWRRRLPPASLTYVDIGSAEIDDHPRGGTYLRTIEGQSILLYPGLGLKSPFVASLLANWRSSLERRGWQLVMTNVKRPGRKYAVVSPQRVEKLKPNRAVQV